MARDQQPRNKVIPLTGRYIPAIDPLLIGESDFAELTNMRYDLGHIKGVRGMTKINTTALSSYPKIRSGIHFRKDQPSESHILVQAFNTGETASKVYENKTAVPNAGDFEATELWDDASGAGVGHFCQAPGGSIAYCNGEEVCLYGGDEFRVSGFVIYDEVNEYVYDFTQAVQNTKQDAENIATLSVPLSSGTDVLTGGTPSADSELTSYEATKASDDDTGTAWRASDYAVPHYWTYDLGTGITKTVTRVRIYQETTVYGGRIKDFTVRGSNDNFVTEDVELYAGVCPSVSGWHDFNFVNTTAYRYYRIHVSSKYSTSIRVGAVEFEMFESQTAFYIGSLRPLQGFKIYIKTANTATSSMSVYYYSGTSWSLVSNLSDGTSSGGITLAQTGEVTFDSTVDTAKTYFLAGLMLYWYKIVLSDCDTTTSIYHVTVDAPFQTLKNTWDGEDRVVDSFIKYDNAKYYDYTSYVIEDSLTDVAPLDALGASSDYVLIGSNRRLRGIKIYLDPDNVNTTASTTLTVYYWQGDSWVAVDALSDKTSQGGISFSRTEYITWTPPDYEDEYRQEIISNVPFYYYKLVFDQDLSASVDVYYVTTIPIPETIRGYNFPFLFNGRLCLLDNKDGKRNEFRYSAQDVPDVMDGSDSGVIYVGNEEALVAGAALYGRFESTLYDIALLCKRNESWIIDASNPSDDSLFRIYKISPMIGCAAAHTLKVCDDAFIAEGIKRQVAVWMSASGVMMFDGITIQPISDDIKHYWNSSHPDAIPSSMMDKATASYDPHLREYHLYIASGSGATSLNTELVYSFDRKGWFKIDRGSGNYLQLAITVQDTDGNYYNYGMIDTGYMLRLEDGYDFNGTSIVQSFTTKDFIFQSNIFGASILRNVMLKWIRKSSSSNPQITVIHYGNGDSTGTTVSLDTSKWILTYGSNRYVTGRTGGLSGRYDSHQLKFSLTAPSDVEEAFEPLAIGLSYMPIESHQA